LRDVHLTSKSGREASLLKEVRYVPIAEVRGLVRPSPKFGQHAFRQSVAVGTCEREDAFQCIVQAWCESSLQPPSRTQEARLDGLR
jgi:hypothetical protein